MEKRILIVDDAVFMRKVIAKLLAQGGYTEISEAGNGEEAMKVFLEKKPDLVLLDITMPGKSGLEVLEEILEADRNAKVIMCSALGQDQMIQKAILAGAADFIVKPFKNDEFLKIVNYNL